MTQVVRKDKMVRSMNHPVWEDAVSIANEIENITVSELIEKLMRTYIIKAKKVMPEQVEGLLEKNRKKRT